MSRFLYLVLLSSFLSTGLHFYLGKRSYELRAGQAGESAVCNISEGFRCDPVLLSPYSQISGVSISYFGLAFNFVLFYLLLFYMYGFISRSNFWRQNIFYLSSFIVIASIVMMGISMANKLYCPLCFLSYILSFISLGGIFFAFKNEIHFMPKLDYVRKLISKSVFFNGIFLLLIIFFLHAFTLGSLGMANVEEELRAQYIDWGTSKKTDVNWAVNSGVFVKKSKQMDESKKIHLVEFADFLCPHCKSVHGQVTDIVNSYPNVEFHFIPFPLDKECNSKVSHGGGGVSCLLARAVICAEKQNKGFELHNLIFKEQDYFSNFSNSSDSKIFEKFSELFASANIQEDMLISCLSSGESKRELDKKVKLGQKVGIKGTPSFYVNGRLFQGRYLLQFLEKYF